MLQVNVFQKHLMLHQLTHDMAKDCLLITSSVHENSKFRTCCVHKLFFGFVLTFRTIYVHNMFSWNLNVRVIQCLHIVGYLMQEYVQVTILNEIDM